MKNNIGKIEKNVKDIENYVVDFVHIYIYTFASTRKGRCAASTLALAL